MKSALFELRFRVLFTLLGILFAAMPALGPAQSRLAVLGAPSNYSALTAEEKSAYDWAVRYYDCDYVTFDEIAREPALLGQYRALWWHYTSSLTLPQPAVNATVVRAFQNYARQGGNFFLSGLAPQYAHSLGMVANPPAVLKDPQLSADWGLKVYENDHPIFQGMPESIPLLSANIQAENNVCWWTDPAQFSGRPLADVEVDVGLVALGEITVGSGKVIVIGTGGYEWDTPALNYHRRNLEQLTQNILHYLGAQAAVNRSPDLQVYWFADPREAFKRAKQTSRPLMVLFVRRGVTASDELERQLSNDPRLARIVTESTIPAKVDITLAGNEYMVERFSLIRVPSIILFAPDGRIIARQDGVSDLGSFYNILGSLSADR